jgi:anti-sigma B factor antagonist
MSTSTIPFRSTSAVIDDVCLVSVSGELDLYTKDDLERPIGEARDAGASSAIVDLSGVSFIDSTAIGVLANQAELFRGVGGRLLVVCQDPRTLRVFEIIGLDQVLTTVPTLYEALREVTPADHVPTTAVAS